MKHADKGPGKMLEIHGIIGEVPKSVEHRIKKP